MDVSARRRWLVPIGVTITTGWLLLVFFGAASFIRFVRGMHGGEQEEILTRMTYALSTYFDEQGRLPSSTPLTPPESCCERGGGSGRCDPGQGEEGWDDPSWVALGFSLEDPHYFQYQLISDGRSFTARAVGDLDCDGVLVTFERVGRIDPRGDRLEVSVTRRVPEETGLRAALDRWMLKQPLE